MRVPTATYRLQLNADFPFARVRELIDYFHALGAGDLYFAPVFQARSRSPHGYDVTNPGRFNREIGDEAEFEQLSRMLHERGIGLLLDIVPNHMAASEDNPWWRDILEHGPASLAARFFDVEWEAPHAGSRIILPVLGKDLDQVLEAGELGVALRDGEILLAYFAREFPLDPGTYGMVLRKVAGLDPALIAEADAIGPRSAGAAADREARRRAALELKKHLAEHRTLQLPALGKEELRELIEKQAFRLEFWRSGTRRINYRRFFDITDLAGVRVEEPDVFATTHSLILELIRTNQIDGVRVDHVDGLRDPARYLQALRAAVGDSYVVVEKILGPGEDLPEQWPVEGTTGYDFAGMIAGAYCDPAGLRKLTESYERRTGSRPFSDIAYEKKRFVIEALFSGELHSLASELRRLIQLVGEPAYEIDDLATFLTDVSACLPVYRTYITDEIPAYDRKVLNEMLTCARHRAPRHAVELYDVLTRILLDIEIPEGAQARRREFIASWQQFTGPATAKGVEDTTFYTYHGLIALSEVGSRPDAMIGSVRELHETLARRARRWPHTMNASSTHDTKRSEDVRARILVLSEMPDVYDSAVARWLRLSERHCADIEGRRFPGINEQVLLFQTLLGIWPLHGQDMASVPERLRTFIQKASREAKQHSSWLDPNEQYEQAFDAYARALINDDVFLEDFATLRDAVQWYGCLNSLSQLVLKLGAPGVPDIYQGNESWQFSLVDPDNRRLVDFAALRAKLKALALASPQEMLANWKDGRIKMHVTSKLLHARRADPELFGSGEYIPLRAAGRREANVIAFARHCDGRWALIVTGRFYSQALDWTDTWLELPAGVPSSWRNVLTGEIAEAQNVAELFDALPFALLVSG